MKKKTQYRRPYRFTDGELATVGIWIIDPASYRLQCQTCSNRWWLALGYGGRLPAKYWICPNQCNAPASEKL